MYGGSFLGRKKLGRFLAPFDTKKGVFQIQPISNTDVYLIDSVGERRVRQTFFKMRIGEMILLPDKSKLYDGILWYINGCNAHWIGF